MIIIVVFSITDYLGLSARLCSFHYFNLFRARRVVEQAFGRLARKWSVLTKTIDASPAKAAIFTYACVCLHNWLIGKKDDAYSSSEMPTDQQQQQERTEMDDVQRIASNNYTDDAAHIRERFVDYFNSEGAVEWQNDRVDGGMY